MDDFNKPNVVLPMVASYDTRGFQALTQSATNGRDQRKVNSYYQVLNNALTGRSEVLLAKRPGVTASSQLTGGVVSADDVQYLILMQPFVGTPMVISTGTTGVKSSGTNSGAVITSEVGAFPTYVDTTRISGTKRAVVQTAGGSVKRAFHSAAVNGTWVDISASSYVDMAPIGKMEHIDGYAFQMADTGAKIFNSDLNTLNTWPTTNFISKSIITDGGVGLARLGRLLVAFGYGSAEVFFNAGNAVGSPLQRTGIADRFGLFDGGTHYAVEIDGRLYFVGTDAFGTNRSLGVYVFDGQRFEKVSPKAIDSMLNEIGNTATATNGQLMAWKLAFFGRSALAIRITTRTANPQRWLMFFPDLKEWFEWNSTVWQPVQGYAANSGFLLALNNDSTRGSWLATWSDSNSGYHDQSAGYDMIHQFKLPKKSNAREAMAWCGVVADSISASASSTAHGEANLYVSFSDNDYQSNSTPRVIDLTQRKKQIYRCGSYEDRAVRLVHSGNAECRIQAFIARTL